jgi:hypothetical protein
VLGDHADAASSEAVYFNNQQEACERLLVKLVRQEPVGEWFWPMVVGAPHERGRGMTVSLVIKRLRESPAGWVAVAAAVLSALRGVDAVPVLHALPVADVAQWLREMGGREEPVNTGMAPVAVELWRPVAHAAEWFGAEDPRVIWLAALAVILESPACQGSRTAVAVDAISPDTKSDSESLIEWDDRDMASEPECPVDREPQAEAEPREKLPRQMLRERTDAAGLYFLLNALQRLEFAEEASTPQFVARVLQKLAAHAGVANEDPILGWVTQTLLQSSRGGLTRMSPDEERRVRVWCVRVRRWCWRTGGIRVREVVWRRGMVSLNRTDLDVSLPLEEVDLRIRRLGLDLDPGWLPWFGRVVRFHYLYRGEFDVAIGSGS